MKQLNAPNTVQAQLELAAARLMGFESTDQLRDRLLLAGQTAHSNGPHCDTQSPLGQVGSVYGSSRTDAGVHALHSTCHVDLMRIPRVVRQKAVDPAALVGSDAPVFEERAVVEGMNHYLRKEDRSTAIAVVDAQRVPMTYHARFSTVERTYNYRVVLANPSVTSAFLGDLVWFPRVRGTAKSFESAFNLDAMQHAADMLIGKHDFSSFCTITDFNRNKGFERSLYEVSFETIDWLKRSNERFLSGGSAQLRSWFSGGDVELAPFVMPLASYSTMPHAYCREIRFKLRARSFLHHQCRFIVATLLQIAKGRMTLEELERALHGKEKHLIKNLAPASGLYLVNVKDELDLHRERAEHAKCETTAPTNTVHVESMS